MRTRHISVWLLGAVSAFGALCGCQQQMAIQPVYKPLAASDYFADGQSARQPVDGTLAQGRAELDYLYVAKDDTAFPLPLTAELVARGQQRYNIYCMPCHGQLGDGNGFIVTRGFRRPPTFHSDRLRAAPVGHFFDVITNGFGAMYDLSAQIPPRDRWAIIAYVRALQLSQNAPAARLTPDERATLDQEGAAQ
ncbi:MAG: cytochrome c [Candidatus Acidiferrales bacterium]